MADKERELKFELAHVPSDDLLGELKKRHERMLFVGVTVKDDITLRWRGFGMDALGMAEYARVRLHDLLRENLDEKEPDDGA